MYWRPLQTLDKWYMIIPATVIQYENYSDIESRNTNYAGYYYPWCQISDPDLGRSVWVPPSAVVSGVYSFNDLVKF